MARIRSIKPDFFTSEDIMALTPLARLLYIGTWLDADREGRLAWKPQTLKVRYLPSDDCDVLAVASELVSRRLVVPYGDGLAYIPSFLTHQIINPRESKSKLPEPNESEISRVTDASLRVSDAPSLPSFPSHSLSSPVKADRARVQGSGVFEPGSLPRDHMRHALCGPSMRICLLSWQLEALAKAYNDPANPHGTRAVISQFVEQLESTLKPSSSIGPFSWVEKEFHGYLRTIGRTAPKLEPPKPKGVAQLLEEEAARKASAR